MLVCLIEILLERRERKKEKTLWYSSATSNTIVYTFGVSLFSLLLFNNAHRILVGSLRKGINDDDEHLLLSSLSSLLTVSSKMVFIIIQLRHRHYLFGIVMGRRVRRFVRTGSMVLLWYITLIAVCEGKEMSFTTDYKSSLSHRVTLLHALVERLNFVVSAG